MVAIVNILAAFVSFLACLSVLILCIILKKWKFFGQRLVLYLTITALLVSVASMIHRVDFNNQTSDFYKIFCALGGFLTQLTAWMLTNAIVSITMHIFMTVACDSQTDKYEWVHIFGIFVLPFLFNWIPFINFTYGRAGVWCWIESYDRVNCQKNIFGMWLQYTMWDIPHFITITSMIVMYIISIAIINRKMRAWTGQNDPRSKERIKRMKNEILSVLVYPVIYMVLTIPAIVNRVYSTLRPAQPSQALWYILALIYPLGGTFIALAFTLDSETRRRLTRTGIRAAAINFCHKEKVPEYVVRECISDSAMVVQSNTIKKVQSNQGTV